MEANGATVIIGVGVTDIKVEGGAAVGITTSEGKQEAYDVIVDCTGPWSRFTGKMVDLKCQSGTRRQKHSSWHHLKSSTMYSQS